MVQSTIGKMQDIGINGLLGLSFNVDQASPINAAIKGNYGDGATWGHSVLHNIFDQHPDQPNYLAIDLARTHDWEDTDGGSFGIGEVEQKYASVLNAPKLPQHPKGGSRWTVLLDGVKVDGSSVALQSSIAGVPAGRMQALLDTGDPTAMMPSFLRDAIYSSIPGAVFWDTEDGERVWIVPCNTTTNVVFTFGYVTECVLGAVSEGFFQRGRVPCPPIGFNLHSPSRKWGSSIRILHRVLRRYARRLGWR